MEKDQISVWEIYQTTELTNVVIVNTKPFKWLYITEIVMDHIIPITEWKAAGLQRPAAVVMEKWETVNFSMLKHRVGRLEEADFMKIAVEYAKRYTCI